MNIKEQTVSEKMLNGIFSKSILVALGALLLISCGGGGGSGGNVTQGTLNIVPNTLTVEKGSSVKVPFQLVGSQGVVNQVVSFSVSDPTSAQVSPDHCVVSSGVDAGCVITVTGKKEGAVTLSAISQGYSADSAPVTVITGNGVGTITLGQTTGTTYYSGSQGATWSITATFQPANNSVIVPASNPITVLLTDPSGFISKGINGAPTLQCPLSSNAPTCTLSGSWKPILAATSYPNGINTTLGITGSWQAGGKPFNGVAPIPVQFTPTTIQSPGTLSVSTQNASGQIYDGMKAPLFVQLNGSTLSNGNYDVTLTIPTASQSLVTFYNYTPGNNTKAGLNQFFTKTCNINFDNSGDGLSPGNYGCGFGLMGLSQGIATINVAVTQNSATPSNLGLPAFNPVFNFLVGNVGLYPPTGRTITITNNSSKAVMFGANNGTSVAYIGPGDLAGKGNSVCGSVSSPSGANIQQCPIGSTCIQGGASPATATTFQCYWDMPTLPSSAVLPGGGTAKFMISGYAGVTSGNQQIQWSGNFYALNCPDGTGNNCPTLPTAPGTGPINNAQTIAEVTFQHNTVDYYDVSIINGVSNSLQWGPASSSGKSSASGGSTPITPYYCGTAGSTTAQSNPSYNLVKSTWLFSPTLLSNFPTGAAPSGSASSNYALVSPSQSTPTLCSTTSTCSGSLTGDTVCGWNLPNVLNATTAGLSFAPNTQVCGAFQGWATADQIWGWNKETQTPQITNQAPFAFDTTFSAIPSSVSAQTTVSVGDLQLCVNNTYSSYESPAPTNGTANLSTNLACGGTNWSGITTPAQTVTTTNNNWLSYVYPTISWLKTACPTCYTYPFDDESSTFTCEAGIDSTGANSLNYSLTIGDIQNAY